MTLSIDLNCDMGEGYGAYDIGNDAEMLKVATSANVACGFHGGDFSVMARAFRAAKVNGVAAGCHPGYPDLWGFGRREMSFSCQELQELTAYQIGAAAAVAKLAGHRLTHVKVHGAMGHLLMHDVAACEAVAAAIKAVDAELIVTVLVATRFEEVGEAAGLRLAREIFADRAYMDDGRLVSRKLPGAVIHDPDVAAERMAQMVQEGAVITQSGKRIKGKIDTICIHGDTPGAVAIAKAVKAKMIALGIDVRPFAST
ncbi:5-oxoprolinase subunit PxpA (plasmid) [Bosea sp. F3-2]|uniref:LamB/YcsF family protein n=1 Tax=Bosea sp. F3-2 TaxID=2599640 RepID=UPI0011EF8438|nr:5-oxoprolinase subunit PxpA [Bosea sp. F3-2]QEL27367.1 5-oxoprolinase subunit PxpA [Bosea sp. F3-2]